MRDRLLARLARIARRNGSHGQATASNVDTMCVSFLVRLAMLPADCHSYDDAKQSFNWRIPACYNIARDVCDKWADGSNRLALVVENADRTQTRFTFDDLKRLSIRFGNALQAQGVQRGDRVAIFVRQSVEAAIAHLAAYRIGCIAVPLFALFGTEALGYRLANSGASAIVVDQEGAAKLAGIRDGLPALRLVFSIDGANPTFWTAIDNASDAEPQITTSADDPAIIIYTSGTTGKPKGALHAHRVLLGHLPGVEMSQQCFPQSATLMWTPADWAWIGGLFDVLLPAWHHGVPVLACRFDKFDGDAAFDLLERHRVSHTFLPPTAIKMMRGAVSHRPRQLTLQSVASGGEPLGKELLAWGRATLGVTINEFYGQTECNMVLSSCARWFEPCAGAIGQAVPGHDVAVIGEQGQRLPRGESGSIAIAGPDPVMFLGYWQDDESTRLKFRNGFLVTGDLGWQDEAGFFHFVGRDDDVITCGGYRIGPCSIEDTLLNHPAVRYVAVVGAPDPQRTEIVCAFIVLKPPYRGDDALMAELQRHVRTKLAAHEYPRKVYFVDELPMTSTGKVVRKALREKLNRAPGSC
ncbi:acetyl-CoA synthetase [Paraburkholderia graminis]|jgi:acetyl-CoA synthetase|nr:acetyl-CoA synthetase [Paraburkholderia graminis]